MIHAFHGFQRPLLATLVLMLVAGCGSRQPQDSLVGSNAQRLISYSIDDMVQALPETDFAEWSGRHLYIESHFIERFEMRDYADHRLATELAHRFDIESVSSRELADGIINVFYTSLGTDRSHTGFFLPLGFMPGVDEATRINLLTLEKFHGIAEMYYYIGATGSEKRGAVIQARNRSDALGLPIITIPISTIDNR